jgi:hypothetical protein
LELLLLSLILNFDLYDLGCSVNRPLSDASSAYLASKNWDDSWLSLVDWDDCDCCSDRDCDWDWEDESLL